MNEFEIRYKLVPVIPERQLTKYEKDGVKKCQSVRAEDKDLYWISGDFIWEEILVRIQ